MAELKTKKNDGDVTAFLDSIENERQRREAHTLVELMQEVSGAPPEMYGTSIVGFGSSSLLYADGKAEDWFKVGFSPRKGKFSLYIVEDAREHSEALERLGKHKTGKACIWVNKLDDIDLEVLREIVAKGVEK